MNRFDGRYELQELLGEGGMGSVWRAWDPRAERSVALKRLDPRRAAGSIEVALFEREFRILFALRVRGVPRAYEIGWWGDLPAFAMELVEGEAFDDHVRRVRPDWRDAVGLLARAGLRLDAIHRAGVVHGDVKPPNLMVDRKGELWWVDFGLGSRADDELLDEEDEFIFGTLAYLPVERVSPCPVLRDPRSDVYSLAVMLHEVLTGRLPFVGADSTDLLEKIHSFEPPAPHRVAGRGIPAALSDAVLRGMAKDPADRPATPRDLVGAVMGAMGGSARRAEAKYQAA